jgi:LysM repeat protein
MTRPTRAHTPDLRAPLLLAALVGALLAAGCGGGQESAASDGPIRTATPYARQPTPLILTPGPAAGVGTAQEVTYKVEAGDTLLAIAGRFDTTVEAIVRRNNLASAAEIRIGQELTIPVGPQTRAPSTATPARGATATASPAPGPTLAPGRTPTAPPGGRLYIVQPGDTAGAIAERFGVSLADLAAANGRSTSALASLRVDETLIIPASR